METQAKQPQNLKNIYHESARLYKEVCDSEINILDKSELAGRHLDRMLKAEFLGIAQDRNKLMLEQTRSSIKATCLWSKGFTDTSAQKIIQLK